jgi:hypothetical protein
MAALRKTSVARTAVGILRSSNAIPSCTLPDVHEPQSASASTITSQRLAISSRSSSGAGRV